MSRRRKIAKTRRIVSGQAGVVPHDHHPGGGRNFNMDIAQQMQIIPIGNFHCPICHTIQKSSHINSMREWMRQGLSPATVRAKLFGIGARPYTVCPKTDNKLMIVDDQLWYSCVKRHMTHCTKEDWRKYETLWKEMIQNEMLNAEFTAYLSDDDKEERRKRTIIPLNGAFSEEDDPEEDGSLSMNQSEIEGDDYSDLQEAIDSGDPKAVVSKVMRDLIVQQSMVVSKQYKDYLTGATTVPPSAKELLSVAQSIEKLLGKYEKYDIASSIKKKYRPDTAAITDIPEVKVVREIAAASDSFEVEAEIVDKDESEWQKIMHTPQEVFEKN